jgi:hypothetical protein
MKKLAVVSLVIALTATSLTFTPIASATNIAQDLCDYVSVDDKKRLRTYLKTNKLKIRSIFKGIQCNGQNLLEFASKRNSLKTGSLIISKLPKKSVQSVLSSITFQPLVDIANERISG